MKGAYIKDLNTGEKVQGSNLNYENFPEAEAE